MRLEIRSMRRVLVAALVAAGLFLLFVAAMPADASGWLRSRSTRLQDAAPVATSDRIERQSALPQDAPINLPRGCTGSMPRGATGSMGDGEEPACCIYGYVFDGDEPVAGAIVRIEGLTDTAVITTVFGPDTDNVPYYGAALDWLGVGPGDAITITASYSGAVGARTWIVQSQGQQVDLGLATGPGVLDSAPAKAAGRVQATPAYADTGEPIYDIVQERQSQPLANSPAAASAPRTPLAGPQQTFGDEFDSCTENGWTWDLGSSAELDPIISWCESGDFLHLYVPPSPDFSDRFPLVGRNDVFTGSRAYTYYVEIRFRQPLVTGYGTSINVGSTAFTTTWRPAGNPPAATDVLHVNHTDATFSVHAFDEKASLSPTDTDWHIVRLVVAGGRYAYWLDGAYQGSGDASVTPQSLWFGNPVQASAFPWTTQQIDYVRVGTPETDPPGAWQGISPTGWVTTTTPDVSIRVQDAGTGLDANSAEYQYSTDGGDSWSGWLTATCNGSSGITTHLTTTASAVPFGQDSATDNMVQFLIRDLASNQAESISYTVAVDSAPPTGSIAINDGDRWADQLTVTLSLAATEPLTGSGVSDVQVRNDGEAWSPWQPYSPSEPWVLRGADGLRTVYARYRDAAGNVSGVYSSTINVGAPVAAFGVESSTGAEPFGTRFTDLSGGAVSGWSWTFGDGVVSGARYPEHWYHVAGAYTVTLTASGPGGSDVEAVSNCVTVVPHVSGPHIRFIYPPRALQGRDTVHFGGSGYSDGASEVFTWTSSLDGHLSSKSVFELPASHLNPGLHTISFEVLDVSGARSHRVTSSLEIVANPLLDTRTLILVNRQRLEALYTASEAASVTDKLHALAAHERVRGLVVQVENDPAVADAYAAWSDPSSVSQANDVAAAIKALIDDRRDEYPSIEYLVIVGDDRVIPFRRVPNEAFYHKQSMGWIGRERDYGPVSPSSTIGSALAAEMNLTDDYYACREPTMEASRTSYIPDLAVGRLIETPDEILTQIDTFLAGDVVMVTDAIATGYYPVQDAASSILARLIFDNLTTDDTLVGSGWGSDEFVTRVLDTPYDLVSINGHADHRGLNAATGELVSAADIAAAGAGHERALFYNTGCHAGLNVPPTNPSPLDVAQALAQHRANHVANTGYGWGYLESLGLSERLMYDFTGWLADGQSAVLGHTLAATKQAYYRQHLRWLDYDAKIMMESTLYGLPMYRYTTPVGSWKQPAFSHKWSAYFPGKGLIVNSHDYQFPSLIAHTTDHGQYYTFGDRAHTAHGEPIQPMHTTDMFLPELDVHGAVFRGGAYSDVVSFDPVVNMAIVLSAAISPTEPSFTATTWYPAQLHRLNRLGDSGALAMVLGQYNPASQTERLYDSLSFDVYYHADSDDWTVPAIVSMSSGLSGSNADVAVVAGDSSGIAAAVVAYTAGDGAWASIDLSAGEHAWSGSFPATKETEFFIQVVDGAGNVTVYPHGESYLHPGDCLHTVHLPLVSRSY